MARVQSFKDSHLRKIAEILADAATHGELSLLFQQCSLVEQGGDPKWERILMALSSRQAQDRCGNNVVAFIQAALDPALFTGRKDVHENLCQRLNEVLSFNGLHIGNDGQLKPVKQASTISEAEQRAGRLQSELRRRHVHPDVLKFCRAELLQENYFHAVLEATKSLSEKIRQKSGLNGDAGELATTAFSLGKSGIPVLAFNSLQTETDKNEQKGLMNLFIGTFGAFRNVTAHGPKILWNMNEQDALDIFTLVSLLHRRLDDAVPTRRKP